MALDGNRVRPTRPDDALRDLFVPEDGPVPVSGDLVEMLRQREIIDDGSAETARRLQMQSPDRSLGEVLMEMGVAEAAVQAAVAEIARIPFVQVESSIIDSAQLQRLGSEYCLKHRVVPLKSEGKRTIIGTPSPDDVFLLDELKRRLGVSVVKHVLVCAGEVEAALRELSGDDSPPSADIESILADVEEDDIEFEKAEVSDTDLEAEAESSPVVRYVNHIIQTAMQEGASDIHIEPGEKTLKVRLRIDGILYESMSPPKKMHAALTSRLKIMANLDIAERRLPQDGRIRATVMDRRLDLRVSTVPTANGEKTVMRILDDQAIQVSLDELGFRPETLSLWKKQIERPHGIILVTGPTGSGKTTTLYSALSELNQTSENLSTAEDPVEFNLGGINQVQMHEDIGLNFAAALRSVLRQDPDIIMVGEIRDFETAEISVKAALTGHMVLSTLHTNDAPSTINRLLNMGIEPFLVSSAVNCIVAQRLARRICAECVADDPEVDMEQVSSAGLTDEEIKGYRPLKGQGCGACSDTGFKGRVAIYEVMVMTESLKEFVLNGASGAEIKREAIRGGMVTLRRSALNMMLEGVTTISEVYRVSSADSS